MGCCVSKLDDLPLVIRCRERKDLLKAAANHRYTLAAAHLSYFIYLKDVGEALRRFVDEELLYNATSSSSSTSSPIVTFHPIDDDDEDGDHERVKKLKSSEKSKTSSSDDSGSDLHHVHHDNNDSHLHLSGDDSDSGGHSHVHVGSDDDHDDRGGFEGVYRSYNNPGSYYPGGYSVPYGYGLMNEPISQAAPPPYWGPFPTYIGGGGQPYQAWAPPTYENHDLNYRHSNVYYMKKSSPKMKTVIHDPGPATNGFTSHFVSYPYENDGYYGKSMRSPGFQESKKQSGPKVTPPPPSPKGFSTFDFINIFEYNGEYSGANSGNYGVPGYESGNYGVLNGYESSFSSPDSAEVRKREGIPDLEEETENEVYGGGREKGKKVDVKRSYAGEGSSKPKSGSRARTAPLHNISEDSSDKERGFPLHDGAFKNVPLHKSSDESSRPLSSPSPEGQTFPGKSSRGITSERHESLRQTFPGKISKEPSENYENTGSIHLSEEMSSSETILSSKSPQDASMRKKEVSFEVDESPKPGFESSEMATMSTHDLREVVAEIRDEFAIATEYGKEVALMLEVGKLPYRHSLLKDLLSRLLRSSSSSSSFQPSANSARLASKTNKLAKSYFGDHWKDIELGFNLSSTLEKLYVWEKKLHKEVKAEEKLRVIYKKQCERFTLLDKNGAEPSKIDAMRTSIRNSDTKLKICLKTIKAIATRIHKLRDDELQPQVAGLIKGLITMWKSMLSCHQKQFQAIIESKIRTLKANTSFQRDSSSRASRELEMELKAWSARFNDWIITQKSYVQSLNEWLVRCLEYEPEETPDGPVPYSPGRLGAPPIFLICNDWFQAMETVSNIPVANAMHTFASRLHELWQKQDEEQRQRIKAQDLIPNELKNRLRKLQLERGKTERELDAMSDRTLLSIMLSENGVSSLDDLKVDLDLVRKRLAEERARHKDAVKLVHDAAANSVQGGLVPIFKALESFSSEALKVHEQVRLQSDVNTS